MVLVIPGVEVSVTKEVVAPQLAPSGILGLVGLTERTPPGTRTVQSLASFVEAYGRASVHSLPEAALALQNGVAELVVSPVRGDPARASAALDGPKPARIAARAPGLWANGLTVTIAKREAGTVSVLDFTVKRGDAVLEVLRGLAPNSLADSLAQRSDYLQAEPKEPATPPATDWSTELTLSGGADGTPDEYRVALQLLESEPDVDLVLAAFQDHAHAAQIHSEVISHCARMSANAKGRIGFGQVPPDGTADDWSKSVSELFSDRFVLLAPNGVAGAVAGMVGSLPYFQSPTFKPMTGLTNLSRRLLVEEQEKLLKAYVVPVATMRGRGTVVVRGLTTDNDQISVRRVADRAVRGVKMIGDLFIGRLNNESGRGALREKLIEFLVQMEKDGAIVPSTDRRDPAFKVSVYSTQDDFSKGIVRVDMAVRPVRAIDYIYATVLVQT